MPENNECLPIVIFPLGVACQVTNPSGPNTSDGTATLIITGGTPPYNITWGNGNSTSVINNLSAGSYPATIVDYYGDFTANTTCVLTGPIIPATTTTTTTSPIVTYDFCMVISYSYRSTQTYLPIYFIPNEVMVNGKESWISDDGLYTIIWDNVDNRWELVDNITDLTVINNNPDYPPLSGWLLLGKKGTVTVTEGECPNIENLALKVTSNETTCTECDGSITIEGSGGVPPYQYSIDGGITWSNSPIFQELCPVFTYLPQIKDITDTVITSQSGEVSFPSKTVENYTISLNLTNTIKVSSTSYEYTYVININPPLPNDGTTIKFNVNFYQDFVQTPYINSATKSYTTEIIKNSQLIPSVDTETVTTYPNTNPGCTSFLFYRTLFNRDYTDLTISYGDVYSIKAITNYQLTCNNTPPTPTTTSLYELQTPEPTPIPIEYNTVDLGDGFLGPLKYGASATSIGNNCCRANFSFNYGYSVNNSTISGCQCCTVQGINYFYNRS